MGVEQTKRVHGSRARLPMSTTDRVWRAGGSRLRRFRFLTCALGFVVMLAACASAEDTSAADSAAAESDSASQAVSEPNAEFVPGVTEEPTAPVTRPAPEAVENSIVRILGGGCRLPALGTGFAVEENLIVTNAHLVAGRDSETLGVSNLAGDEFAAVLVGFDPDLDLALLRVADGAFTPLNLVTEVPIVDGVAIGLRTEDQKNIVNEIEFTVDARVNVNWDGVFQNTESRFSGLRMLADIRQGDSGSPLLINDRDVIGLVQSTTRNQPQGYAVGSADISSFVERIGPILEADEVVVDRCA